MARSIRQATVDRVNEIRRVSGLDPIPDLMPGERGSTCECPIARSVAFAGGDIFAHVDDEQIYVSVPGGRGRLGASFSHTPESREFVARFDTGLYRDLAA